MFQGRKVNIITDPNELMTRFKLALKQMIQKEVKRINSKIKTNQTVDPEFI